MKFHHQTYNHLSRVVQTDDFQTVLRRNVSKGPAFCLGTILFSSMLDFIVMLIFY